MTEAKIKEALKILNQGVFVGKSYDSNELKDLLEQELIYSIMNNVDRKSAQKAFEYYIRHAKISYNGYSPVPNMYGIVNEKQVFSNHISVYIMKKPFFKISPIIVNTKFNSRYKIASPMNINEKENKKHYEKLVSVINDLKDKMKKSTDVTISKKSISNEGIIYSVGEELENVNHNFNKFKAEELLMMFKLLGHDLDFKLSDTSPLLTGESGLGKCYVLGVKP